MVLEVLTMGAAWYIMAEDRELQSRLPVVNGKFVAKHLDYLGARAEEHGEPRPEAYFGEPRDEAVAAMAAQFGVQLSEPQIARLPDETWYAPDVGLRYVERLIELVGDDRWTTETVRQEVLQDLEEYRAAYRVLIEQSCRWHFAVEH
jgi:hypothetical protein